MKKFSTIIFLLITVFTTVFAQTPPPGGATIESWYINYTMSSENYGVQSDTEAIEIAFSGSDIYFNFPNPLNGAAWVKGSIANATATFATGQSMGTAIHGGQSIYFCGVDGGGNLCFGEKL